MRMDGGRFHISGVVAAVLSLAAFAPTSSAYAEPTVPTAAFASVATPNMRSLALAFAAPTYDLSKLSPGKFLKETPELSFDTVDLGKSSLRFDLVDNGVTRPDMPDLSDVIVPLRPGKKRSTPRYFGFTLVTPTQ
jgi:hypothetical protein